MDTLNAARFTLVVLYSLKPAAINIIVNKLDILLMFWILGNLVYTCIVRA